MSIRLVPKLVTLNDLERRNRPSGCLIPPEFGSFLGGLHKRLKMHGYFLQQKCRPKNVVFNDISFMSILAGDHSRFAILMLNFSSVVS